MKIKITEILIFYGFFHLDTNLQKSNSIKIKHHESECLVEKLERLITPTTYRYYSTVTMLKNRTKVITPMVKK